MTIRSEARSKLKAQRARANVEDAKKLKTAIESFTTVLHEVVQFSKKVPGELAAAIEHVILYVHCPS